VGQSVLKYSYDPVGNLLSAALPQASASFAYDARNQLVSINRANGVASQYLYDPAGRMLSMVHTGPAGVLNAQAYTYDATGNRTSYTINIAQPLVTQAAASQYDAANRLIQSNSQTGSTAYSYDASGNLVSTSGPGAGTTFSWDSRGRLQSIAESNGQTSALTYDFGRNLISQRDSGPTSNLAKSFLLDDLADVAYLGQSNGDNLSILAGQAIDDHLAVVHSTGQIEYGATDAINSTVASTDQSGARLASSFYEPFGQTSQVSAYPFQYTGRVSVNNQLLYYRARYYDPSVGRFVSEDPVGFQGGDVNLYRYVSNRPVSMGDPSGLGGAERIQCGLLFVGICSTAAEAGFWPGVVCAAGAVVYCEAADYFQNLPASQDSCPFTSPGLPQIGPPSPLPSGGPMTPLPPGGPIPPVVLPTGPPLPTVPLFPAPATPQFPPIVVPSPGSPAAHN